MLLISRCGSTELNSEGRAVRRITRRDPRLWFRFKKTQWHTAAPIRFATAPSAPRLSAVPAVRFHLSKDHLIIAAAGVHKLLVVPTLVDAPFFHQQDQVGAAHGGKTMGDHESRPAGEQRGH